MKLKLINRWPLFGLILLVFCCNGPKNTDNRNKPEAIDSVKENNLNFDMVFETIPSEKDFYKIGENPVLRVILKNNAEFDSVQFTFDKKSYGTFFKFPVEIKVNEKISKTGKIDLNALVFNKGYSVSIKHPLIFVSDIEPKNYSFEIVKIYPHDRRAFTQGLVYEDGFFYESNGIKSESTLRKVQLGTGEPIQSYTLAPEVFAEGLTIFGDKIVQLSWQNYTGFVYDKKSFKLIGKFSYATEGWGLTNDGKQLIMSDGSNRLYFLDPESYTETSRIDVYDNKGPVNELNELEYIKGEIFANIYRTDKIARIDPASGRVLAYIDLSRLLPERDYESNTDVLNGIAYDSSGNRLFVTGKRWPKVFEIKLKLKNQ